MDIGSVEILDYKVLTGTLANFKHPELLGLSLFPSATVEGNIAAWDVYSPSRVTGNFRVPGAAATKVDLVKVASRTATLAPVLLEKTLDDMALSWLRSGDAAAGDGARARITREQADLDRVLEYTKEYTAWKALSGTLAVNQGDVKFTVDYGLRATHKPTASASWATASTDVIADIKAWKALVSADCGYAPADAYCNESVMEYLMTNDDVTAFLGEGSLREQIAKSGYITRFMGLDWHVYNAGYIDGSGAFQKFIGDDKLFIVAAGAPFGAVLSGSQEIPAGFSQTRRVYGKFAYSAVESNPPGVRLFVGENFLPVIYIPDAIVAADVTP
jgi:hypothetical protein